MATRGYEFYLRVLKVSLTRSLRSLAHFQHSKLKLVSPRGHVISLKYDRFPIIDTVSYTIPWAPESV